MPAPHFLAFPKSRRLVRKAEFDRVKQEGTIERGRLLVMGIAPVQNSGPFRAGFVVTRRIGPATVRNRVRRRLREIVRRHQHEIRPDFWMVLIAKGGSARADYNALEDEWLRLATRASILSA